MDSAALVAGIIIGSGIFLVPTSVASSLHSKPAILAAWIVGGALSLIGALAYAELGAMMPATGGQYVYLRESVGPLWAFLCGWSFFIAARSGGIATLAVGFATYLAQVVPLPGAARQAAAAAAIAAFTYVNYRGVKLGAFFQRLLTVPKLLGLAALIAVGFAVPAVEQPGAADAFSLSAFGTALIACFWAYQGWVMVTFVAGEIANPERNLPHALASGVLAVVVLYVLTNAAYLRVLTIPDVAAAERPATAFAKRAMGASGSAFMTALVLVTMAGSLNGLLLTSPRLYFAQARDGLFFRKFGKVHPRYETPAFSILAQGVWSAVLAVLGSSFEALFSYSIFSFWVFYGLTVAGLMVLRRKRPHAPRPYRIWGYPVTPLLFVVFTAAFSVNAFLTRPGPVLAALALMLAGVPVYYLRRRVSGNAAGRRKRLPH